MRIQDKEETNALRNVHGLVERSYVKESHPRHHLPSARQQDYTLEASAFFIINHDEYAKLTKDDIHNIFKKRHILILNVPAMSQPWNRQTLAKLGALTQRRDIQGKCNNLLTCPGMIYCIIQLECIVGTVMCQTC